MTHFVHGEVIMTIKFLQHIVFSSTHLVRCQQQSCLPIHLQEKLHVILVMPVATVQVQRLFTCINKILGDGHLSLNLELVDALLRITVDEPDTNSFETSRVVHHCYSTAHRNPDNSSIQESFNVLSYSSCILRLPVYIVYIVRAFLYLPALQMFSNVRTVFIMTLRLCFERPFYNNVVFLSNRHNG